jgi:copper chaperone NosL
MLRQNRNIWRRVASKVSALSVGLCVATWLGALVNCQKKAVEAVAIEANDTCSFCKMAISEKRYASEFIDSDGEALKFDDIGCMANFINQKRTSALIDATFVMDYEAREWIKAENAFYVRSSEFQTPMNGGIVAFKDQSKAREAVSKYYGTALSFSEVVK